MNEKENLILNIFIILKLPKSERKREKVGFYYMPKSLGAT
jgi:hypothetical protein